ncbi:MAG: rhomboid family intramembrane serine protease [Verrucomicrobia bacterium]|nr:MAG: rhomboid family intramembrane serine protease [Verrucomicrobiota bacterium]
MNEHPPTAPELPEPPRSEYGDPLAVIGRFTSRTEAADRGLVVLAMGFGYWIFPDPAGGWLLCVEPAIADAAREQIRRSARENAHWPPRMEDVAVERRFNLGALAACVVVLVLVHLATGSQAGASVLAAGRMDAVALVAGGEWWRAVTALTLHADLGHLVANLGAGGFFAHFVARRFGAGPGWLLIVLAGALGNGLTALAYYPQAHVSIGASTAVFGALGLLALSGKRRGAGARAPAAVPMRRRLLPLAAAAAVLGLYGAGGLRTDVVAHAAGFLAGLCLGWAASWLPERWLARPVMRAATSAATVVIVAAAWWTAWWTTSAR